jgi:tetratricopeptide (TPR) repeat protein
MVDGNNDFASQEEASLVDVAKGILNEALRVLESAQTALDNGGIEGTFASGRLFLLANMPEQAIEAFRKAVGFESLSLDALGCLAIAQIRARRYPEALDTATKLVSLNKSFELKTLIPDETISSLAILGDTLILNDKPESAIQAYRAALDLNAQDNYATGRLAQVYLTTSKFSEAADLAVKTGNNPRFRDTRAISRISISSPNVVPGLSISSIKSILEISDGGRPFLVDGERRQGELVTSELWNTNLTLDFSFLNTSEREQVGAFWSDKGREEHASIAAFSRFILQLLRLGAPPELIAEAARALSDEIEHAKLCFGIASAALGYSVGVGSINMEDCLANNDNPWSILEATLVEGCIGETVSSALEFASLNRCKNDTISTILKRIAKDEIRHSKLAWKSAKWILEQYPELREKARKLLSEITICALSRNSLETPEEKDSKLVEYGLLPSHIVGEETQRVYQQSIVSQARLLCDIPLTEELDMRLVYKHLKIQVEEPLNSADTQVLVALAM